MRIAFDVSATRGRKTGIGVYTDALVDALRNLATPPEIVLLDDGASVDQRTDQRILREQFTLPNLALAAKADILHLTGFAAPLRSRVPVVLTVMDLIGVLFAKNFPLASRFYWSRYLPFTLGSASHIVTLSHHTKRDLVRLTRIHPQRISVVPPGLDARFQLIADEQQANAVRARLNLPSRYFLFVSTLEPRKGIDTLIAAFALVASQLPEHLVIVGKRGWYYRPLFAQVRAAGLGARVHFADYIADADLPALYYLATAFVFPSRYEGFGLTPLEAMACGAPVIASNASSLPEVVGDAGILLAPQDVMGFARAMLAVASSDAERFRLRALGIERAQAFSWDAAAQAMAQIYAAVHSRARAQFGVNES
ncbi:MAG: glycosyltransferase family 4 protein [Chloroflexi bacterium]|nr:glycosyltransferase family 4 protein [Chloroflexota bacterium]